MIIIYNKKKKQFKFIMENDAYLFKIELSLSIEKQI